MAVSLLGRPNWASAAMLLPLDWLPLLQILLFDGGLLLPLYAGWCVTRHFSARVRGALSLFAPRAGLAVLLYAAGVWIVFQPMETRSDARNAGLPDVDPNAMALVDRETRKVAQNKFLYSALMTLPEARRWQLEVTIKREKETPGVLGQVSAGGQGRS